MDKRGELEQAIENHPDDSAAYSVLADYLQSHGDPRGELIALALQGKDVDVTPFLGPLAPHTKVYDHGGADAFTWRWGFIHSARFNHNSYYKEKLEGGLAPILEALLAHPSGRFLSELVFVFNGDPNESNLQDLIDILARAPRPTLRSLVFGDIKYAGAARDEDRGDDTEISWYSVGDLSSLWPQVPRLEKLIVKTGGRDQAIAGGTTLGELALPALRHCEYHTGGIDADNSLALAAIAAPKLAHLDIWYGQKNYGGAGSPAHVQQLLARTDLPELRHLGLMNCEFIDDVIESLVRSPLAKQLTELDLSLGCLTDAGAQQLAQHKDAFPQLHKLAVTHSYLGDPGIAALRGFANDVATDEQREQDTERRYAAVGE